MSDKIKLESAIPLSNKGMVHIMTHPIPDAALDDRLGYVGTAGSGKTYNAGSAVERLLSKKRRCVIIDPLGVWYGLRLHGMTIKDKPRRDAR